MSNRDKYLDWLLSERHGLASVMTITSKTGTACPCLSVNGSYSPQYHADHPEIENCQGRTIISVTTSIITIKAVVYNPALARSLAINIENIKAAIGEIVKGDMILIGSVNLSTGAYIDLSGYVEANDKITIGSTDYAIKKTINLPGDVAQLALLREKS